MAEFRIDRRRIDFKGGLMGNVIYTYDNPPNPKHIKQVCKVLQEGGIIAYPTDVNWAFGCIAGQISALEKLQRIKPGKPKEQPFTLLCKDISMVSAVGTVDQVAYRILKKRLPGPYTVVLEKNRASPKFLRDKRKTVGIRIPESPLILAIIEELELPLVSTSAPELPDGRLPKFGYEVDEAFGHLADIILDLGEESPWLETSILDLSSGEVEVIRHGAGDLSWLD